MGFKQNSDIPEPAHRCTASLPSRRSRAGILLLLGVVGLAGIILSCEKKTPPSPQPPIESIMNTGEIRAYTLNRPDCYFKDGERSGGFEYELAAAFAEYLGVNLEIRAADTVHELFQLLEADPASFMAVPLPAGIEKGHLKLTVPYTKLRPAVVIRRNTSEITSLRDLGGMAFPAATIAPPAPLPELTDLGIRITAPRLPFASLISEVLNRRLPALLTSDRLARHYRRHEPGIRILASLNTPIAAAWGVHVRAETLKKRLDAFLKDAAKSGLISSLRDRHDFALDHFDPTDIAAFHRRIKERLPIYFQGIRSAAREHGLDWRLIAAMIYQESRYNPTAVSNDGAIGLMQVMPATADGLAQENLFDPSINIPVGVRHLKSLHDFFDQAPDEDRLAIALAAYNVGQGHVYDARNIARSMKLDPNRWSSLAITLPMLSEESYYRDALYGFCRGDEPVEYVRNIMIYYDIMIKKVALSENPDNALGYLKNGL